MKTQHGARYGFFRRTSMGPQHGRVSDRTGDGNLPQLRPVGAAGAVLHDVARSSWSSIWLSEPLKITRGGAAHAPG